MFGWEFPPHITGGLGTACYGMCKGLLAQGVEVIFVAPKLHGDEDASVATMVNASDVEIDLRNTVYKELFKNLTYIQVESGLIPYMGLGQYFEIEKLKQSRTVFDVAAYSRRKYEFSGAYRANLMEEVEHYAMVAVEIAMRRNIPLVVKSTFSDAPGTLITSDISGLEVENSVTERRISGVTYLKDLVQFRVQLDTKDASSGRILFEDLAAAGISVSCLNLSESSSMFAVFSADAEKTVAVLDEAGFAYTVNKNCAKVSVVFAAVRGFPGLMAKFVSALADNKINILQTVDSDTTISAIVKEEHICEAVTALHKAFKL